MGNVCFIEVKIKILEKLTPREVFRLQGFPENFKFSVSDLQAYKQAGNAVPINVVEKVCSSVINYLEKIKKYFFN